MFSDFDVIKEDLDIVNKSFVTMGKGMFIDNVSVKIRDTMLLAPGAKKALKDIGSMYDEEYRKIELSKEQINDMERLIKEDKELFERYAIRDAVIGLVHASYMEEYNFKLGYLGIPMTLSSLSSRELKKL
jgi:hypothetical protein